MPTSDKEAKRAEARAGLARAKQWRDERRDSKSPIIKKKKSNQSGAPESSSSTKKKKSTPAKRTPSKAKKVAVAEEAPAEATTYRKTKTPSREDRAKAREKARQWSSNRSNRKHTNISKNAAAVVEEEDIGIPKVVETKNSNGTSDSDDFKTAADTESKTAVVSSYDLKEIQCIKSDMKSICTRFGILSDKFAENLGIDGHEKNDKDDSDAMDCE